jgi:hypothetical protein
LEGTEIDDECYGMLLSELPNIANITFRQNEASLLRHIAVEILDTIALVSGDLEDIDTVTHKCTNTPNITMCQIARMYWLFGRKTLLSLSNKLLLYKTILKPIWT